MCETTVCAGDSSERNYGGCEGPNAAYVKLISSDDHEFIIKREHALTSGTIKAMLSGPGSMLFVINPTLKWLDFHLKTIFCQKLEGRFAIWYDYEVVTFKSKSSHFNQNEKKVLINEVLWF